MAKCEIFLPGTQVWTPSSQVVAGIMFGQLWPEQTLLGESVSISHVRVSNLDKEVNYSLVISDDGLVERPASLVFETEEEMKIAINNFLDRMEQRINALRLNPIEESRMQA